MSPGKIRSTEQKNHNNNSLGVRPNNEISNGSRAHGRRDNSHACSALYVSFGLDVAWLLSADMFAVQLVRRMLDPD